MRVKTKVSTIAGLLLAVAGCVSVSIAPDVTPALVTAGGRVGASRDDLERGRSLLTTRCIACHGLQPIQSRTAGEWRVVVDKMAPMAKLDPTEKKQLVAYLLAAREGE